MNIQNANNKTLCQTISQVPDVWGAVASMMQQMIFEKMQRQMIDGSMQAIPVKICSMATFQPLKPQDLAIKPVGDRAWAWYMIHSLTDLCLKVNDRFKVNCKTYKVMGKSDFSQYGYFYYECIEDIYHDNGQ